MRSLFVTAVLIAVGVVAADKPCLKLWEGVQFTYEDGLTIALNGPYTMGKQMKSDPTRWAMTLRTGQGRNLFHIRKDGMSTYCVNYTMPTSPPYPLCIPDDAKKIGDNWVFLTSELQYVFYKDSNPSQVVGRSNLEQGGKFHRVVKWSDSIIDRKLLDVPQFCRLDNMIIL